MNRPDRHITLMVFPGAAVAKPSPRPTERVLPRFHFGRPLADGSIPVADRIVGIDVLVYLPKTQREFEGGHQRERWYVRQSGTTAACPTSRPFATFERAVAAIADGSWDLIPTHADRRPVRRLAAR